ncbi:MAG: hypothetical protein JNM39_01405 [Bdellovibrionaceae bacterium]|nr:hypothetical protein [Pseudobdellovibrionaceae bacterium]
MILCSLVLVFSFVGEATTGGRSGAPSNPTAKSFKEWKDQKIQEIQTRIDLLQARIDSQLPTDTNLGQLKTQLKNDSYSLEMAKELTVSDYFVAYLAKLENRRETYKEIAARMSADEIADLMSAYVNSIFSAQTLSTPAPQGYNLSSDNIK